MSVEYLTLPAISSRIQAPFADLYRYNLAGSQELKIQGGWVNDVPSIWRLNIAWIQVTTDANVGNRYYHIKTIRNDQPWGNGWANEIWLSEAIPATSSKNINFAQLYNPTNCSFGDITMSTRDRSFLIYGDDYMHLYISGEKAGDLHSVALNFEWLNWDLGVYREIPPDVPIRNTKKGWFW